MFMESIQKEIVIHTHSLVSDLKSHENSLWGFFVHLHLLGMRFPWFESVEWMSQAKTIHYVDKDN